MDKPIGQLIKEELASQEHTVTWLAKQLNCHRVNVYNIFRRDNIDLALLIQISKVLHRNFIKEIANEVEDSIEIKWN